MKSQESQLSHEWELLLGSGVRMKTVVRGGGVAPELGSLVLFHWIGRILHQDGTIGVTFAEREGATARIGDGDEIPGQGLVQVCIYSLCQLPSPSKHTLSTPTNATGTLQQYS